MEPFFSEMEQSIITNMIALKSVKYIAMVLDSNVEAVSAFIDEKIKGTDTITYQMKIDANKKNPVVKAVREKKVPVKKVNQLAETKKQLQLEEREKKRKNSIEKAIVEAARSNSRRQPVYKTKKVDYSQLITVKIDHKTTIYAKPGENIEEVKRRYFKNYGKSPLTENEI